MKSYTIDQIELHDSDVLLCDGEPDELVLHLRPAYVHHWECLSGNWVGVGRIQDACIRIAAGAVSPAVPTESHEIAGGWFRVGDDNYKNMIPVPLSKTGAVTGRLVLVGTEALDISGAALSVELVGEPKDIESLPEEWAPG